MHNNNKKYFNCKKKDYWMAQQNWSNRNSNALANIVILCYWWSLHLVENTVWYNDKSVNCEKCKALLLFLKFLHFSYGFTNSTIVLYRFRQINVLSPPSPRLYYLGIDKNRPHGFVATENEKSKTYKKIFIHFSSNDPWTPTKKVKLFYFFRKQYRREI